MDKEKVQNYAGKKVFLVLKNDFKYTTTLPEDIGDSFDIIDKFGDRATIECSMVTMIGEVGERQ